jgi:hypothetical protein
VSEITGELNAELAQHDLHPRATGIVAELQSAYEAYLRFAQERGALDAQDAETSLRTVRAYLMELVKDQAESNREAHPGRRFVALLIAGLGSGRYYLSDAETSKAPEPHAAACGWRKEEFGWRTLSTAERVGYIDPTAGKIYLIPDEAQRLPGEMTKGQGHRYENVEQIGRELADAGLIEVKTEKTTGKVRYQLEKRIRGAGKQRYYVMPIEHVLGSDAGAEGGGDHEEDTESVSPVSTSIF